MFFPTCPALARCAEIVQPFADDGTESGPLTQWVGLQSRVHGNSEGGGDDILSFCQYRSFELLHVLERGASHRGNVLCRHSAPDVGLDLARCELAPGARVGCCGPDLLLKVVVD